MPKHRNPAVLLTLFLAIFALQVLIALLGYRYIGLASEYSSRNLIHLDAVTEAQSELEAASLGSEFPTERLIALVSIAREQAVWCTENLLPIERQMMILLGAAKALEICENDIKHTDQGLDLLAKLSRPADENAPLTQRPFALIAQLKQSLRFILKDSRDFAPHVVEIREKLKYVVRTGTLAAGLFMMVLFAILSRNFLSNWRSLALQSREIQRQSDRFKLAMQSNVDGLALFDSDLQLLGHNQKFADLLSPSAPPQRGCLLGTLLGDALKNGDIANFDGDALALLSQIRTVTQDTKTAGLQTEISKDRHVVLTLAETGFGDILFVAKDVTLHVHSEREKEAHALEMQRKNEQVEASSKQDPLTGLMNRRGLDDALVERSSEGTATLIRIDLDRFKQVNDVFGHEAGDFVLVHVANLLNECCRKNDIPVRVGGDEFLILCAPGTNEDQAVGLSKRLLEKVQEPILFNGKQLIFGASFGVASSAYAEEGLGTLLRSADAALYLAKNSGRSTVRLFTPELRKSVNRDRALAETFLPGLKAGDIKIFAQSIHNAQDWSFAGVEVLARWQHPDFGLLSPDAFLPVVKQLGMEADLDESIFFNALNIMRDIENEGFHFPRISFNVSAGRLLDPRFQEIVQDAMFDWEKRIAFEILETISLDEGSAVVSQIRRLQDVGIEFDVDDFGSDHASINSVIEIGPSTVKIDRKIITPLGTTQSAETMVKTIVEMGKALGVKITAEGIENEIQARAVARLGGDRLQGYFFSQPMPVSDLVAHVMASTQSPANVGVPNSG